MAAATHFPHFGPGAGFIVLDSVSCSGNEANLTQCNYSASGVHNCAPRNATGVFCSDGKSVQLMIRRDIATCTLSRCK